MPDDKKIQRSEEQLDSSYDPEKEIPDPEQVERDRQRAEQEYGNKNEKKPAA